MSRYISVAGALVAGALLAGCSREPAPPRADAKPIATTATTVTTPAGDVPAGIDPDELRARIQQATQAQRLFSPAGDNALEYSLALRKQAPEDANALAGLVDFQPQLVIAIEQAIATARYPEAQRLLGLLERADAQAPALSRLREMVAAAETAARARIVAADADSKAKTDAAEAALRRQAEANATKLVVERAAAQVATVKVPTIAAATLPPAAAPPPVRAPDNGPVADRLAPASQPTVTAAAVLPPPRTAGNTGMPRLTREVAPQYPAGGRRLSGVVQIAFTINGRGEVESPRVVSSNLPNAFERSALSAAGRWKFEATGQEHQGARTLAFAPPAQ